MLNPNLYYQLVKSTEDCQKCLKFYENIFIGEKRFSMVINDHYTQRAFQYVLKNKDEIIAAYRIIPGKSKHDFPVGEFTELPLQENATYAEFSRLAFHPDYRGGIALLKKTFADLALQARILNITHLLGEPILETVTLNERFGFKRVGEPFFDSSISRDGKPNSILILASVDELYLRYFPS